MNAFSLPTDAPSPVLIDYGDLVRCTERIDGLFEWQGWEDAAQHGGRDLLFIHKGRLGCYRSARDDGSHQRGCAAMPFPFGDFLVTSEMVVSEAGRAHRIETELQLFFFTRRGERRRDLWSGRLALVVSPDGTLSDLELSAAAGVLDGRCILRRLRRRYDCNADPTCWQVVLGTTLIDVAVRS